MDLVGQVGSLLSGPKELIQRIVLHMQVSVLHASSLSQVHISSTTCQFLTLPGCHIKPARPVGPPGFPLTRVRGGRLLQEEARPDGGSSGQAPHWPRGVQCASGRHVPLDEGTPDTHCTEN